jgi:hypothetical protein
VDLGISRIKPIGRGFREFRQMLGFLEHLTPCTTPKEKDPLGSTDLGVASVPFDNSWIFVLVGMALIPDTGYALT